LLPAHQTEKKTINRNN